MEPQTSTILPQPSELLIQDAVAADVEAIVKIGIKTFTLSYGHSMPAEHVQAYLNEAYTQSAISKDLASDQNHFLVAKLNTALVAENGKAVGFIQMKLGTSEQCIPPDVPMCELHRIYVSSDHFGGGTGQRMMERGLEWARDHLLGSERLDRAGNDVVNQGAKERRAGVWLGVWEENVKAQRFYRRWGFEEIGAHNFNVGGTTHRDIVMVKWL